LIQQHIYKYSIEKAYRRPVVKMMKSTSSYKTQNIVLMTLNQQWKRMNLKDKLKAMKIVVFGIFRLV
jgi:hypothetical protein